MPLSLNKGDPCENQNKDISCIGYNTKPLKTIEVLKTYGLRFPLVIEGMRVLVTAWK